MRKRNLIGRNKRRLLLGRRAGIALFVLFAAVMVSGGAFATIDRTLQFELRARGEFNPTPVAAALPVIPLPPADDDAYGDYAPEEDAVSDGYGGEGGAPDYNHEPDDVYDGDEEGGANDNVPDTSYDTDDVYGGNEDEDANDNVPGASYDTGDESDAGDEDSTVNEDSSEQSSEVSSSDESSTETSSQETSGTESTASESTASESTASESSMSAAEGGY